MNKAILTFVLGICFIGLLDAQKSLPSAMVNDLNGKSIDISKYVVTGKPKIISLWATWCGPCRMELNALQKVYPKWKDSYGVEIIAVTVDVGPQLERAKSMFEKNGWTYTFLHDNNQDLMSQLGIRGIPYSILLDGKGNVVSVQTGYYPGYEKELEAKIKNL